MRMSTTTFRIKNNDSEYLECFPADVFPNQLEGRGSCRPMFFEMVDDVKIPNISSELVNGIMTEIITNLAEDELFAVNGLSSFAAPRLPPFLAPDVLAAEEADSARPAGAAISSSISANMSSVGLEIEIFVLFSQLA